MAGGRAACPSSAGSGPAAAVRSADG